MRQITSKPLFYILTSIILIGIGAYYSHSIPSQKQSTLTQTRTNKFTDKNDKNGIIPLVSAANYESRDTNKTNLSLSLQTDKSQEMDLPASTQDPSPIGPTDTSLEINPPGSTMSASPTPIPQEKSQIPTPLPTRQNTLQPAPSGMEKPQTSTVSQPTPSRTRKTQTQKTLSQVSTTTEKPRTPAVSQPALATTQKPQTPEPPSQAPTATEKPQTPKTPQSTTPLIEKAQPVKPEEMKPTAEAPKVALSLEEAINLALVSNFDIAIERFNPKIAAEQITVAESRFDPLIAADANGRETISPAASQVTGTQQENLDVNAGFQQTLSPGTTYQVAFTNNRLETDSPFAVVNPAYRSSVLFTLTQPLLKNFGTGVNRAPILIARNNRDISLSELRNQVIRVISDVQSVYWDLVFTIGNLEARQLSLRLAQDLVRINKAQVEVGTLAPIEVLQAESSAAAREEAVLVAEQNLRDTEDRLKRILNFREGALQFWEATIVPLDKPPFQVKEVSVEESIKIALQKRPEITQARINLENTNINVRTTRNQLLPALNLEGSVGLNGLGTDYGDNLNELTSGDFYSWQVGVNFEFPIGNRAAKSNHVIAKLATEQAEVFIKNVEQQVILEVRQAVRQLRTDVKRVEVTRIARELAERQLDAEQKKFNEGLSTNFNVLEFQEDLANAVSNEVRAITDYNKSLVNLERVLGTTLEVKNIKVE